MADLSKNLNGPISSLGDVIYHEYSDREYGVTTLDPLRLFRTPPTILPLQVVALGCCVLEERESERTKSFEVKVCDTCGFVFFVYSLNNSAV